MTPRWEIYLGRSRLSDLGAILESGTSSVPLTSKEEAGESCWGFMVDTHGLMEV